MNENALRELSAASATHRMERDAWRDAYNKLDAHTAQLEAQLKGQLVTLKEELETERAAWRREIRRARGPGFGVFAGAGYTPSGIEPVVGVGLVWRLW